MEDNLEAGIFAKMIYEEKGSGNKTCRRLAVAEVHDGFPALFHGRDQARQVLAGVIESGGDHGEMGENNSLLPCQRVARTGLDVASKLWWRMNADASI